MKVVDEDAVQEFMNNIKTLLRRAQRSLPPVLSRPDNGGIPNSGLFESRENEGIREGGRAWPGDTIRLVGA